VARHCDDEIERGVCVAVVREPAEQQIFVAAPTVTDDDLGGKPSNITSPVLSLKLNFPEPLNFIVAMSRRVMAASLQFRNSRTTAKFCSAAWLMSGRPMHNPATTSFFTTRLKWTSADAGSGSLDFANFRSVDVPSEAAPASDSLSYECHAAQKWVVRKRTERRPSIGGGH
jgi:hypothetical protein